jgi:WD40 repeat protein
MRAASRATTFLGLALLAGGLAAALARAQEGPAGRKYALLIGVKQYAKGDLRSLSYTEADMEGLAKVLAESGYPRQNITVMTQKAGARNVALNPTLDNIRATVKRWVANRGENDTLLLAFAGHGVQFRGSKVHFFCPADAKLSDPKKTMLPVQEMYELLGTSKAAHRLLLVDACRNDPLVDNSRGAGGGGAKLPEVPLDSDFRPDTSEEGAALALYSCSRGEKAYEDDGLGHSVFYHFVIQGLAGEADKNGNRDGKVTLPELLEYVQYNVPKFSRREFHVRQMPELQGTLRGPLVLAMVKDFRPEKTERPSTTIKPQPQPVRPLLYALKGHTGQVRTVALAPNGRLAASGSGDQTVRLWDAYTGKELRTLSGHKGLVETVSFSANGSLLLSGGQDKILRVWDLNQGRELFRLLGHKDVIRAAAFSPDGKWVVSAGGDKGIYLWDVKTRKWRYSYEGHTNYVYALAVGPDSWHILSGSHDKTVRYWVMDKGQELWRGTHNGIVYGVAISPDGRWGLSGSADHTMRLWNLRTGAQARVFQHPNEVNGVAFSPDGRHAVSGCDDGVVRVWDLQSGRLEKSFSGHTKLVYAVAYSRDGRIALSGGFDNMVGVWNLSGVTAAPPPVTASAEPPPVLVDKADLQISVSWNTATDVDLHVIEPDGTKCYWDKKKTPLGGCLLNDVQDGTVGPEQYQAVKASRGTYKVKLHYYSGPLQGQTAPTRVTVVVRRFVGTPRAETYRYERELTKKDQTVDVVEIGF